MKTPKQIKSDATAFRIWQWCEANGWEHTAGEIAEALGDVTSAQVSALCQWRGWNGRIRRTAPVPQFATSAHTGMFVTHEADSYRSQIAKAVAAAGSLVDALDD